LQRKYHGITFGEGKGMVRQNLEPDTCLNWAAVVELTRLRKAAAWELLTRPSDPRERLTGFLDAWAGMDEAAWPEANVKALYEDIMDIFQDHPEADRWYREWRQAHPEAKLV
jgi:hypothetical protein